MVSKDTIEQETQEQNLIQKEFNASPNNLTQNKV